MLSEFDWFGFERGVFAVYLRGWAGRLLVGCLVGLGVSGCCLIVLVGMCCLYDGWVCCLIWLGFLVVFVELGGATLIGLIVGILYGWFGHF